MRRKLLWDECWPVIEREVRYRNGFRSLAFDRDDLIQEASITALACMKKFDATRGTSPQAYVRQAIRNHFARLMERASTDARCPKDDWGRSSLRNLFSMDAGNEFVPRVADGTDWEAAFASQEIVRELRARVPETDFELLVSVFVEGAEVGIAKRRQDRRIARLHLNLVKAYAATVLDRIMHQVKGGKEVGMPKVVIPETPQEELPECHARGTKPQGYNVDDVECHQCPDKFTCLPEASGKKLITGGVPIDREVEAVLAGKMKYEGAIERMRRRKAILTAGGKVPPELLTTYVAPTAVPQPAPEPEDDVPEPEDEQDDEEEEKAAVEEFADEDAEEEKEPDKDEEQEDAEGEGGGEGDEMSKRTKKVKKAKAAPKPKAKGEAKRKPGQKREAAKPRELVQDQMESALKRVKIGQPFDLEYGMQLVRKQRDDKEIVVKLTKEGFEMGGKTYGSLTACAQKAIEGRKGLVSGNFFFSVAANSCTEIRNASGKVLASKVKLEEKGK